MMLPENVTGKTRRHRHLRGTKEVKQVEIIPNRTLKSQLRVFPKYRETRRSRRGKRKRKEKKLG